MPKKLYEAALAGKHITRRELDIMRRLLLV